MMKRICFIGPYPPPYGGMAIQLKTMAENLSKDGLEIQDSRLRVEGLRRQGEHLYSA